MPADAAQAQGKEATPAGKRKQHRSNGIASPCHPLSVALHDLHEAPMLPMRIVGKFESAAIVRRTPQRGNRDIRVEPSRRSAHHNLIEKQPSMARLYRK
ncbi:hypothetical protein ROV95_06180 [Stenotrophomonas maltophilia group sp. msm1]|uniref:hypothetical protein n=1 Tax=Stenotrophomonas maltophilia group sp. msm1 TaxID=3061099 RepID=UPI002893E1D7|nr:hypothetical protein [Stenotrophomonas maltophilia group sp. msm1]MDT3555737.1 hypothetical protein [Stenotrophomonas maltophilia group sp. msm1]